MRGELEDLLAAAEADDAAPAPVAQRRLILGPSRRGGRARERINTQVPGVVDAAIFDSGDHDRESLAREALRRALAQEQAAHRRTAAGVDAVRLEAEEARAHFQVALATERAETVRLRSLVRKLSVASSGQALVDDYERQLEKLKKRNARLQRRNVQLELARRSSTTTCSPT